MTSQEIMIKATEKNLKATLEQAIVLAGQLNWLEKEYDWSGIDCEFDDHDLGEMLKAVYNALATGSRYDDSHQDEIFKN